MIQTFEQYNNTMDKFYYLELGELGKVADRWSNDNPHNNGYAIKWEVLDPEESAYPEMENYLLSLGLKIGDIVIIHSVW